MKKWLRISCVLCVFGFLKELTPSEPYNTEFLLGPWRNVTQDEVNRDVYPIGTYSYVAQLVVVFLIADFLRYKPLIIVNGLTGIIVWGILIWTTSLHALQVCEVFYGTYLAAEVAYYTYMYAKVDKKYYQKVTSHTRAATFCGKVVASILAQVLINFKIMDFKQLNYITLAAQILATIWAFGLPQVKRSLYFHREDSEVLDNKLTDIKVVEAKKQMKTLVNEATELTSTVKPFELLWTHFYNAYTNLKVIQWSICYAAGLCGYWLIYTYVQVLWKEIAPNMEVVWNGAVDAGLTAFAALTALGAGYLENGCLKPRTSLLLLAILSAFEGVAILICCLTENIYVSYVGYILFGGLYGFTITVASAEIARHLDEDSYGLVFGINTLFASIMQTILTLAVISETGFALSARGQFSVYAFYYIFVSLIYFISVLIECILSNSSSSVREPTTNLELEQSKFIDSGNGSRKKL